MQKTLCSVATILMSQSAHAQSYSVDVDPSIPGIQSNRTVSIGSMVTIDVVLTELDPEGVSEFSTGAGGAWFDDGADAPVGFDAAVLTGISVDAGPSWTPGGYDLEIQQFSAPGIADFVRAMDFGTPAPDVLGFGDVIFSMTFVADALGSSDIQFISQIGATTTVDGAKPTSGAFFVSITSLPGGTIDVVVPAPSTVAMIGVAGLAATRRRR